MRAGDQSALEELFELYRPRLLRAARLRLDPRLRDRVDEDDVFQDVCLEAWQRLDEYLKRPEMPFFVWLRIMTGQKLYDIHRRFLGTKARDPRREVRRRRGLLPDASSVSIVCELTGHMTSPSGAAIREEARRKFEEILEDLKPEDREIIVLRNFESLTNVEAAYELGISTAAASKRYVRALARFGEHLERLRGVVSESWLRGIR